MAWLFNVGLYIAILLPIVINAAEWPPDSSERCSQKTKQKAMYGRMTFEPSFKEFHMKSMSVDVEWDDLQFAPFNIRKKGGVYVAYTTGIKSGPGGYFGVQIHKKGGQFLFSIWDSDRWNGKSSSKTPKISNKLTWPMDMKNCKRNCQDCGMAHLKKWRKEGLTTGTQCKLKYPDMKVGSKFELTLNRITKQQTINTKDYGNMPIAHAKFGEVDREIKGGVWELAVVDKASNKVFSVGKIMFEGDGRGMYRLGTFDEMLGCNKCNSIYHKDTRSNLKVMNENDDLLVPTEMYGSTKFSSSTCKKYMISGSKDDISISFEGGPLTKESFYTDGKTHKIW